MLKIVGGKHRGRALTAPEGGATRPTASRAREALFNILVHAKWREDGTSPLIEARVLEMPEQYFWAHKRFKTRPPGELSPYKRK